MKYCVRCGKELFDDAAICVGCGCMVQSAAAPVAEAAPVATEEKKRGGLLDAFSFVFSILMVVYGFLTVLAFAFGSVFSEATSSAYSSRVTVTSDFYADIDAAVLLVLLSFAILAFGVAVFVMTLVERKKGKPLYDGILKLIISVLLPILSFCIVGS